MHVAILGPGRLGRSMAMLLERAGHRVSTWRRGEPMPGAELAWLTVSDGAVAQVAAMLPPGPIVLHASGALGIEPLRPHRPAGSLHPLQSFPGPELGMPPVAGLPAALAGDPEAVAAARRLALDIGFEPFEVPGDRRLYHAAAVMAGNFATVLLAEAARLLELAGLPATEAPRLLAPLAATSIRQAASAGPAAALTGPFARGDAETVRGHIAALSEARPPGSGPGPEALYRELGRCAIGLLRRDGRMDDRRSAEMIRSMDRKPDDS